MGEEGQCDEEQWETPSAWLSPRKDGRDVRQGRWRAQVDAYMHL